jgi:hypothetical protein
VIDIYRYSKRDGEGAIQRESEEELKTLKERERGLYDAIYVFEIVLKLSGSCLYISSKLS